VREQLPLIGWLVAAALGILLYFVQQRKPLPVLDTTKKDELEKETKDEEKKLEDKAIIEQQKSIDQHDKAVDVVVSDLKNKTQEAGDDSKKVNDILMDTGKDIRG